MSVSASSPPSCCQAFDSITTNVSAGAEKEAGSCSQVDIRLQDSDCRAGSDEAYAVRRAAGVNASHDPGREEQGAMCVKASPETLDPRQVHKRRQQQLFSLLAASAAAAVTRPDIRSACQSSSNCRRNNMHSSPVVNDDARNPGQNWESSETSPEGSSEDLSEQLYLADDLILRELSEMRQILQKLLEQNKELSLITSPLVADDDILSAVLGLASATAAGQSRPPASPCNAAVSLPLCRILVPLLPIAEKATVTPVRDSARKEEGGSQVVRRLISDSDLPAFFHASYIMHLTLHLTPDRKQRKQFYRCTMGPAFALSFLPLYLC